MSVIYELINLQITAVGYFSFSVNNEKLQFGGVSIDPCYEAVMTKKKTKGMCLF